MKKLLALVAASAAMALLAPATIAEEKKGQTTEGAPTSDRTPGKETKTPEPQVDTTKSGETSDRTPKNKGAATSETGSAATSMQTWDQSYQTTKEQEEQLKSGGASKAKKEQ